MNQYLERDNFIYIKNFITPERATELAKEFKTFAKSSNLEGDPQIPESSAAYNYVGFLELLCEKTPEVSKFLGETALPTYSYARVYHHGGTLAPHTDRPACEISLTVNLSRDTEWPIFIKKPDGEEISLNLEPGDAMMYLGCEAVHWRETFQGQEYVQVFLHYVRSRGKNSFAYFDKSRDPTETTLVGVDFKEPAKSETITLTKTQYKKNIEDYIVVFDNIIPNELCDRILKEYSKSNEWKIAGLAGGTSNTNIRNVHSIGLSFPEIIQNNIPVRQGLDNDLYNVAALAIKKYNEQFPEARIEQDSGYDLLRYTTDQFYTQHTDSFKAQPRAVSCSFALNDDFDGGEFAFFNRELKYKIKKGSVIMFPSNFMYPHEILPVTRGTRYSIITWFI